MVPIQAYYCNSECASKRPRFNLRHDIFSVLKILQAEHLLELILLSVGSFSEYIVHVLNHTIDISRAILWHAVLDRHKVLPLRKSITVQRLK